MVRSYIHRTAPYSQSLSKRLCLKLLAAIQSIQPAGSIFNKKLSCRLQLRLMQMEIIDRAYAQHTHMRKRLVDTVHKRAAGGAEIIAHELARGGSA